MNKGFILALALFLSFQSFSQNAERRKQLLSVINEELVEIKRLNKQIGAKNPALLIRLAELLLEKARLIKEEENIRYLQLPIATRRSTKKSSHFRTSTNYFKQAQKTCLYTLKRFRKFKGRGIVYYILAFNAKEFRDIKGAKKYFRLTIKNTKAKTTVNSKAKLSLAEIYFNEKQFKRSIPLYEAALSSRKTKWWTKDAYNLAWSYYKIGNYPKAIRLFKQIEDMSRNDKYIDMRRYVERDMALFYIRANKVDAAVSYYEDKKGGDIIQNLLKISQNLVQKGEFTTAEDVLKKSLKIEHSKAEDIEIRSALLSLYERFGRVNQHLDNAQILNKYYSEGALNKEKIDILKYHAGKMAATLQKQVVGKTYRRQVRTRQTKARIAVDYFKILANIEKEKSQLHYLHAGETLYSANLKSDALPLYEKSQTIAKERKDRKVGKLALDGMMVSLSAKNISKVVKDKYISKVYEEYLSSYPKSKRSYKIYQRLFSEQISKKDVKSAEQTLERFKKAYPKDYKTQEAMVARIMDHYKKGNDTENFKRWIAKINVGEYKVTRNYAAALRAHLLNMQFEGVEKASSKGDKLRALKGYARIYKDKESNQEAKKNSAYNMAVLFNELGDPERTYRWSKLALSLMSNKDVKKFESSFLSIAAEMFERRKFNEAAEIYEESLTKLCSEKSSNKKVIFKNASVIYLAVKKPEEANALISKAQRCKIPASYISEARLDVLKSYGELGRWSSFVDQLAMLEGQSKYWPEIIYPMYQHYTALKDSGRFQKAKQVRRKMGSLYAKCKSRKLEIPLEGLDVIAFFKLEELESEVRKLEAFPLAFPEETYNSRLKSKFSQLDVLTTKSIKVLETGSGKGIVRSYRILVESYKRLAKEIESFTPPGKSKDYVRSFKKSMRNLSRPIRSKSQEFFANARKEIIKSKILSFDNSYFMTSSKLPFYPEYHGVKAGVIMDRGGVK